MRGAQPNLNLRINKNVEKAFLSLWELAWGSTLELIFSEEKTKEIEMSSWWHPRLEQSKRKMFYYFLVPVVSFTKLLKSVQIFWKI